MDEKIKDIAIQVATMETACDTVQKIFDMTGESLQDGMPKLKCLVLTGQMTAREAMAKMRELFELELEAVKAFENALRDMEES